MNNEYPKILILGQTFNNFTGGGITLSNLFRGWPKDRIAVLATGHLSSFASDEICDIYYQLGIEEYKWIFPFNLIQNKFPSGLISLNSNISGHSPVKKKGVRDTVVNRIFYPFLKYTGLFHSVSGIRFSQRLKEWLNHYSPEMIYIQVSTRETILFASGLLEYLKVPSAIHMMDDWPSTISNSGLFKNYWKSMIIREFKILLDKTDLQLSISEAMSEEYCRRYQKNFIPFHNPVDVTGFERTGSVDGQNNKEFRIIYIGRIGVANKCSLESFAISVSEFYHENYNVTLDIHTPDLNIPETGRISDLRNVTVGPPVAHERVPSLLMEHDLLLLPLDFTGAGLQFARFSIPTKASEYLISGTPVLVFAPGETAISGFCSVNKCGYCLTNNSKKDIKDAVHFLIGNPEYRKELGENAVRIAKQLFDAEKVRKEFQDLIINTWNPSGLRSEIRGSVMDNKDIF